MASHTEIRTELLAAAKWLCDHGFFGGRLGSGGNVSARIAGRNQMVVTPSGIAYRRMNAADICVLDLDLTPLAGSRKPSIEAAMHAGIYRHRTDAGAVVHTHSVYASVLTLLARPIPALFDEAVLEIGPRVELIEYAPSGSRPLVDRVSARLQNGCCCYLIQNHGAVSLGANLDEAMRNAELLEKLAKVYLLALSTGEPISRLPESAIQHWMAVRSKSSS